MSPTQATSVCLLFTDVNLCEAVWVLFPPFPVFSPLYGKVQCDITDSRPDKMLNMDVRPQNVNNTERRRKAGCLFGHQQSVRRGTVMIHICFHKEGLGEEGDPPPDLLADKRGPRSDPQSQDVSAWKHMLNILLLVKRGESPHI